MKKLVSIAMALLFTVCLHVTAFAAVPETVQPLWDNILSMSNNISFDGTSGTANATVIGRVGTTYISATLTVYEETENGWKYVDSTSAKTEDSISLSLKVDFTGESGVQYKSILRVTVTNSGTSESETNTTYKTCP